MTYPSIRLMKKFCMNNILKNDDFNNYKNIYGYILYCSVHIYKI